MPLPNNPKDNTPLDPRRVPFASPPDGVTPISEAEDFAADSAEAPVSGIKVLVSEESRDRCDAALELYDTDLTSVGPDSGAVEDSMIAGIDSSRGGVEENNTDVGVVSNSGATNSAALHYIEKLVPSGAVVRRRIR